MTLTDAQVKQAIIKRIGEVAPEADLNALRPDENVRESLDIDSYDFLNVLIGLSEDLGIEVPEADYAKLATLKGMADYFVARGGEG
ncbi:acyl carrier protein [Verrucomicrobiota bacterium sgz303538]